MKKLILICVLAGMPMLSAGSENLEVATFEDLGLSSDSYWCGRDGAGATGIIETTFDSGSFSFVNQYWTDLNSWSFFAYSSRTGTTYQSYTDDQFNSITGGGAGGSATFGLAFPAAYMGETVMTVGDGLTPVLIPGMEIVNSAWVVDCILRGDGMSPRFVAGDWLKLVLTGYVGNRAVSTAEYYLADYRSRTASDHYYLDEWKWIDLSPLGAVTSVHFAIESSKSNSYGTTTPTYVCIDNVGVDRGADSIGSVESNRLTVRFIAGSNTLAVSGMTGEGNYSVTDMSGAVVKAGSLTAPNDGVELSDLSAGIYIVTVKYSRGVKSLKFVRRC